MGSGNGWQPTVVICYHKFGDASLELGMLAEAGVRVVQVTALDTPEGIAATREADALMVTVQRVPADLLAGMERCRIVCRVGTGLDAIDIPAATARGVWVTNVPDYAIDEVSTHALALALAQIRNLRGHLAAARGGDWSYQPHPPVRRLTGQTLGVLGFGRIGKAMGRKARGVGFRVVAHDPYLADEEIANHGAEPVGFERLLGESDVLSLHVPLTPETRHVVDAAALALMRPTAYLVNTARGEVVDVDALLAAVRAGRIAGAAVDVLPTEPPREDDPLLAEPRILVTPHVAWASEESAVDVRRQGVAEVLRVLRGEPPRAPANEVSVPRPAPARRGA